MEYPTQSIARAVEALSRLPGIGKKTALRLVLHVLRASATDADELGQSLIDLRHHTRRCADCGHLTDTERCGICTSPRRTRTQICVVEDARDVMALERTGQYQGLYHVLGGLISPLDGIGPAQLHIEPLLERIGREGATEVILALSATLEGDQTAFYLSRRLGSLPVRLSHIARGIPVGGELEFADEVTLARSLQQRTPYVNPLSAEAGASPSA